MTNKTIINGIDVSKCKFYQSLGRHIFCFCTDLRNGNMPFGIHCENYKDCYFKQLKRKEQEYERLKRDYFKQNKWLQEQKQEYENYKIANAELEKENDELQNKLQAKDQECEKLIKEKSEIKKYLGISDKTIIQRLEELQEFKDELKISEYNYKQALDEIEEFCIVYSNNHDAYETVYKHILDIINKANKEK